MPQLSSANKITRARVAISSIFFIAGFIFATWASRIPHIQQKLLLSDKQLGILLFCLPVGLMISLLVAGFLVTKFGSRLLCAIGVVSYGCILTGISICNSIFQLGLILFLFGFAGNIVNISINTQAVMVEKLLKKPIMASFHGIWSVAGFCGAGIAVLIISMGTSTLTHFGFATVCALIILIISYSFLLNDVKDKKDETPATFFAPHRSLWLPGIIAFSCLVCEGAMFDWSGVYFLKAVGTEKSESVYGYTAFMGCMAAGRFLGDKLVAKFGKKKMLIASGATIFTGIMLAVLFPMFAVAIIGFMLTGFGVSSVVPIIYSTSGNNKFMLPAQALAAVSTIGFLGFLAGPPMIGFIADASTIRLSFAVVACFGLATSLLSMRLRTA